MKVSYSCGFDKKLKKAPMRIKKKFVKQLKIFAEDKTLSSLRNHKLHGKYKGCWSINITGNWRAIYRLVDGAVEWVEFVEIGTHSELYG